jgi:hypothetical protein
MRARPILLQYRMGGLGSLLSLLAAAGVGLVAPDAGAAVAIAGDLEADVPVNSDLDAATGLALRLGWQLHLPALELTPEIGWHYASFGDPLTLHRGIAGVRVAFGEIFRFGGYAHVGVAREAFDIPGAEDATRFSYDIGGFFDFTLLPLLNAGVHAGYGRVDGGDSGEPLKWIPVGIHVALIL